MGATPDDYPDCKGCKTYEKIVELFFHLNCAWYHDTLSCPCHQCIIKNICTQKSNCPDFINRDSCKQKFTKKEKQKNE